MVVPKLIHTDDLITPCRGLCIHVCFYDRWVTGRSIGLYWYFHGGITHYGHVHDNWPGPQSRLKVLFVYLMREWMIVKAV